MAVTFPISMPAGPGFVEITWDQQEATFEQVTEFTFQRKVFSWEAQRRQGVVKFLKIPIETARAWEAFVLRLQGVLGTFYLSDPLSRYVNGQLGDAFVGGQVAGGSQTGQTLTTDGWPGSTTSALMAGDYVSVEDRLYQLTADANSDGSGVMTLELWPFVTVAHADNAVVKVGSAARGIFCLSGRSVGRRYDAERFLNGLTLEIAEVVPVPA